MTSVIYNHKIAWKFEKGFFYPIWLKTSQREIDPLETTFAGPDNVLVADHVTQPLNKYSWKA